jgi:methionine-rich copper-binding protein CopC
LRRAWAAYRFRSVSILATPTFLDDMARIPAVHRIVIGAVLAGSSVLLSHRLATSAPAATREPFHLELLHSEPAVNETLTVSPKRLKLWFSESIELKGTSIRLANARNEAVKLGKLTVDTAALAPAVVVVPQTLTPGKYTVTWRAAGDDGHPSTGKFAIFMK